MPKLAEQIEKLRELNKTKGAEGQVLTKEIKDTMAKVITLLEETRQTQADIINAQAESNRQLTNDLLNIKRQLSNLPKTNLSTIEASLKEVSNKIKTTDLSKVTTQLSVIDKTLKSIKLPKTDLAPILAKLNALSKPRNVDFEVITNSFGFPTKVIAREHGNNTIL